MKMKIKGLDQANRILGRMASRSLDLRPALDAIGRVIVDSIQTNFEVGGRPPWKPLKPSTIARKKRHPDKILIETERLKDSITHEVTSPTTVVVGTNVVYAPVHQFGFKGQVEQQVRAHTRRAHTRRTRFGLVKVPAHRVSAHTRKVNLDIPARPFIAVQPEDLEEIRAIIRDYLLQNR
jgi:phage gpG-like protein